MIGCRRWRPNWFAEGDVSSLTGGDSGRLAAKAATSTIPDRLHDAAVTRSAGGLVASLNRPGGNVTGVNLLRSWRRSGLELLKRAGARGTRCIGVAHQIPQFPRSAETSRKSCGTRRGRIGRPIISSSQHRSRARCGLCDARLSSAPLRCWSAPDPFFDSAARSHRRVGGAASAPAIYHFASSPRPAG